MIQDSGFKIQDERQRERDLKFKIKKPLGAYLRVCPKTNKI
jgi:hypothetical protein